MSGDITTKNACTGFPNPISLSAHFFPSCFLCIHSISQVGRAPKDPLHAPDSLRRQNPFPTAPERRAQHFFMQPQKREAQGQAVLPVRFNRSKFKRIFAHQRCCQGYTPQNHPPAGTLSENSSGQHLRGYQRAKVEKFIHKANLFYMRITCQNCQCLFTLP